MRAQVVALLAFALAGCGGKEKSAAAPEGPTTRYREGDWVIYRYSGSFTKQAVVLREDVKEQHGVRLRIQVHARRGVEEREWVQVVTDLPENREKNIVDELYLVDHGALQRLANPKNRDLYALYDWTYFVPDQKPTDVSEGQTEVKISDVVFTCKARRGKTRVQGHELQFEEVDCPDFLWKHAGGRYWDPSTNEDFYKAEVVGFGRK